MLLCQVWQGFKTGVKSVEIYIFLRDSKKIKFKSHKFGLKIMMLTYFSNVQICINLKALSLSESCAVFTISMNLNTSSWSFFNIDPLEVILLTVAHWTSEICFKSACFHNIFSLRHQWTIGYLCHNESGATAWYLGRLLYITGFPSTKRTSHLGSSRCNKERIHSNVLKLFAEFNHQ